MKYIALFGPPAVGKSDLVRLAQEKGMVAYDIEQFGSSYEERKKKLQDILKTNTSKYSIFGAADMKREDFPPNTIAVLLLPPKQVYEERLNDRDKDYPHKAGQHGLDHYEHFLKDKHKYNLVFDDAVSDESLLKEIFEESTAY